MTPAPRSLILDLLSTAGRRPVAVRALVAAAGLFAVAENSLRVALARLRAEGLVERDERGLYRLGPSARALNDEVRGWRGSEARLRPWDGAWIGVHAAPRPPARQRRARERALRLLGFRRFAVGLELRPANLAGGVPEVRRRLTALGLEPEALVFGLAELAEADDRRARSLWDAAALVAGYRAMRSRLEASAARLPALPRAAAMRESFLIGGEGIRQLVLDPLLPEPIVASAERRALAEAMQAYDRIGRRAWQGWLGAAEPDPERCPADVRGLDGASGWLRAASGG